MHTIKLDLKHGLVLIDSALIEVDEKGRLAGSIAQLCSPPIQTDEGRMRYSLSGKANVWGNSADVIIEVEESRVCAITFLFDFIEFLEFRILESKVLKACEKSLNLNFRSDHPSTACLDSCEWGQVKFFYDAKQGDLSLEVTFKHSSTETISQPDV